MVRGSAVAATTDAAMMDVELRRRRRLISALLATSNFLSDLPSLIVSSRMTIAKRQGKRAVWTLALRLIKVVKMLARGD